MYLHRNVPGIIKAREFENEKINMMLFQGALKQAHTKWACAIVVGLKSTDLAESGSPTAGYMPNRGDTKLIPRMDSCIY